MKRSEAFKLCEKMNPPMYPPKPMPYAVAREGREYFVVHLPTKKFVDAKEQS